MSYDQERKAIESYFKSNWSATSIGYDGHPFTPEINTIRLTINSGARLQGSIGRMANRIDNVGTLVVSIYTEGGRGSSGWRGYAETLITLLHGKTLDTSGVPITATADAFLRFSPNDQHPYISASFPDAPFLITNITAPFVRYEYI
nr:hypothetical protein [uncultured Roseovarius sp.]